MAAGDDIERQIRGRLELRALEASSEQIAQTVAYIGLLTKWNESVNLTGLPLAPIHGETIDRLIVEPALASQIVGNAHGLLVDVGSGGGSPAIPLKIWAPDLTLLMVESRARKAAFLREVVRQLSLSGADVFQGRVEELATSARLQGAAAFVSVRAVRTDDALWRTIGEIVAPGGAVLWFRRQPGAASSAPPSSLFNLRSTHALIAANHSELAVLRRL